VVIYAGICIIKKMTIHCLIVLAVSEIIVILVMNFETNANKHIHAERDAGTEGENNFMVRVIGIRPCPFNQKDK